MRPDYGDTKQFNPGDRVEIHPRFDLWMQGAQYGAVVKQDQSGQVTVRMDHRQVKKLHVCHFSDLKPV